ncbi:MAG: DUF3795 domain-containing protein [bacterium]|nr:DUF3795 domain-containing protein [bacterium]
MFEFMKKYMESPEEILSVCGDDCSVCPRYRASTDEEYREVAEFWYRVGWRDHIATREEMECHGCSIDNNCRYKLMQCTMDHGVKACNKCTDYPCEKIQDMHASSDQKEAECRAMMDDEDFAVMKRAFYCKRELLEKL